MNRLRAFIPLVILIAIGVAVGASGMLEQLSPHHIMAEQASWARQIGAHPVLTYVVYVAVLTISIATALPGPLFIIIAGGMLFGMGPAIGLSLVGEVLGSMMLVFETAIGAGLGQSIAEGQGLTPNLITEPHIWLPLVGLGLLALIPVVVKRFRSGSN